MGIIAILPLLGFGLIFFHPYVFAALVILPIFGVLVWASFLDLISSIIDAFGEKPEERSAAPPKKGRPASGNRRLAEF